MSNRIIWRIDIVSSKLCLSMDENKFGEFKIKRPDFARAISQLTFGTYVARGAIQDQPECYIHVDSTLFRPGAEEKDGSAIAELISKTKQFIATYVEPSTEFDIKFSGAENGVMIFELSITGDDNLDRSYLYGLGYDDDKENGGLKSSVVEI